MRATLVVGLLVLTLSAAQAAPAPRSATERARDRLAAKLDVGESAPDWLMDSETYAIGYNPADWDALAAAKVSFVTHCPIDRDFFARAHTYGIRCFPYVTFYQASAAGPYEGLDLRQHPEAIEVDANGNLTRTGFWDSEDAKNWYTTCPNEAGYQDAMVAWVKRIMELGADGVFVDNLAHRQPCFGPKFGKHKHLYADQDHAFAMLLKRVREVIKRYQPQGAVLGNSAAPLSLPKEFWKYLDADMLESFILTWVSKDRWFDWNTHWHKQIQELQPLVRAGKQIQCLSYLGHTPYGVREDAFYAYCTARLGGMVWNGGAPLSNAEYAPLYQIRLGAPLGEEQQENGVWYRVFERGLVAVNPQKDKAGRITLKPPVSTRRLVELGTSMPAGWNSFATQSTDRIDATVAHGGQRSVVIDNKAAEESLISQTVTLNQTKPTPILAGGWSKAASAAPPQDANYSVYLDIQYHDGSNLFGQIAPFTPGTHDWEYQQVIVKPTKPIKSLTFNCIYRYRAGKVWFDDLTLKEGDQPEQGVERLRNPGFEEAGSLSHVLDATATGFVDVPAYSGRVYLFGASSADDLTVTGPHLTIATAPGLGEVRFRIDGFDYWTHSGSWGTEYQLGPEFGQFTVQFAGPGKHTVEVVDVVPAAMKTPSGYGSGERLGTFMDPSQPTKPLGNRKFHFRGWTGAATGANPKLELEVQTDCRLTAEFDVSEGEGAGRER